MNINKKIKTSNTKSNGNDSKRTQLKESLIELVKDSSNILNRSNNTTMVFNQILNTLTRADDLSIPLSNILICSNGYSVQQLLRRGTDIEVNDIITHTLYFHSVNPPVNSIKPLNNEDLVRCVIKLIEDRFDDVTDPNNYKTLGANFNLRGYWEQDDVDIIQNLSAFLFDDSTSNTFKLSKILTLFVMVDINKSHEDVTGCTKHINYSSAVNNVTERLKVVDDVYLSILTIYALSKYLDLNDIEFKSVISFNNLMVLIFNTVFISLIDLSMTSRHLKLPNVDMRGKCLSISTIKTILMLTMALNRYNRNYYHISVEDQYKIILAVDSPTNEYFEYGSVPMEPGYPVVFVNLLKLFNNRKKDINNKNTTIEVNPAYLYLTSPMYRASVLYNVVTCHQYIYLNQTTLPEFNKFSYIVYNDIDYICDKIIQLSTNNGVNPIYHEYNWYDFILMDKFSEMGWAPLKKMIGSQNIIRIINGLDDLNINYHTITKLMCYSDLDLINKSNGVRFPVPIINITLRIINILNSINNIDLVKLLINIIFDHRGTSIDIFENLAKANPFKLMEMYSLCKNDEAITFYIESRYF